MSHIWMSHVTDMNESCAYTCISILLLSRNTGHTCEWVMRHIWMSHVTHVDALCHAWERVTSHIWMGSITLVNKSCRTCEWVLSHMCMCHITHTHQTYICALVLHKKRWYVIWLRHVAHMNRSCDIYDSFISHYIWCEWVIRCIPLIHAWCETTYGVTWLSHICIHTHSHRTM